VSLNTFARTCMQLCCNNGRKRSLRHSFLLLLSPPYYRYDYSRQRSVARFRNGTIRVIRASYPSKATITARPTALRALLANCSAGVQRYCYVNELPCGRIAVARMQAKSPILARFLSYVLVNRTLSARRTRPARTGTPSVTLLFSKSSVTRATRGLFCDV